MKKRNLLIISYDYPPSTGGIARLCHEITVGLTSFYDTIKIITVDVPGASTPYNEVNVEILRLPPIRLQCEIATIKVLRKLENKSSYDVLCGIWHPEALLAILGGMKRVYILAHGAELLPGTSVWRKSLWLSVYAKWILVKAQKVITNSQYTKGLALGIEPRSNAIALPLAVNHTFFKPKKSKVEKNNSITRFVTVSRILAFKGHDFILETFESLPKSIRDHIEWHIAGTGPYLNDLKASIAQSPIQSQIYLHGYLPDKELPDFYNTKDVFILATREEKTSNQVEGFGLVFLEAQSSGIPVIGTNTGGIADAIEQGNGGWLFEQDDKEALITIITRLINTPDLIEQQSRLARARILKNSTWEIYCSNLYKILSE